MQERRGAGLVEPLGANSPPPPLTRCCGLCAASALMIPSSEPFPAQGGACHN